MYNDNGKIKVSNTLENRLELLAQQVNNVMYVDKHLLNKLKQIVLYFIQIPS